MADLRKRLRKRGACEGGIVAFKAAKRAAQVSNIFRREKQLNARSQAALRKLFPELAVSSIRYTQRARLPANWFKTTGTTYAMTFGYRIYWRGRFDENDPHQFVNFIHEVVHVEQVRRLGGERRFACEYGNGYVKGGGKPPSYRKPFDDYELNPLESEAYNFEAQFQDERGKVIESHIPWD